MFDCANKHDGPYPNPSECAQFCACTGSTVRFQELVIGQQMWIIEFVNRRLGKFRQKSEFISDENKENVY